MFRPAPIGRRRLLVSVAASSFLLAGCLGPGDQGGTTADETTTAGETTVDATTTADTTVETTTDGETARTDGGTPTPDPEAAFDFWVGEWDLDGETVLVDAILNDNLLFERGSAGTPWVAGSYFDPSEGRWRRVLVDEDGRLATLDGAFADGELAFAGRRVAPDGTARDLRATFAPAGEGRVDYRVEESADGETWTTVTDATATRRGDPPGFPEPTAAPSEVAGEDPATLPPRRRFDFWIGEWDVMNPSGETVGTNVVQPFAGGSVLVENWVGGGGGEGKSLNYYDAARDEWVQEWVHDSGGVIVTRGGFEDGAMRMVGHRVPPGDDERVPFRSTFSPNEDGSVTQLLEQGDGDDWETAFEGRYVRRNADE